jgi:hypothetical protein
MTREELELLKVDDIREMCKERGIPCYRGKNRLKKSELIDSLFEQQDVIKDCKEKMRIQELKAKDEEGNITDEEVDELKDGYTKHPQMAKPRIREFDVERRYKYIEDAEIGTIVAAIFPNGKVKSAKIINKSSKNKKLKLETSYGKEVIVPYKDIIWVRYGERWPRGILALMKSNENVRNTQEVY